MSLTDQLRMEISQLVAQIDTLDADYRADRAAKVARLAQLRQTLARIPPALEADLDALGALVRL